MQQIKNSIPLRTVYTENETFFFTKGIYSLVTKDYQTKPHLVEKFKSLNKGKANVTFNVTDAASLKINTTKNTVTCLLGQINKIKDSQFINMSSVQKDSFTLLF